MASLKTLAATLTLASVGVGSSYISKGYEYIHQVQAYVMGLDSQPKLTGALRERPGADRLHYQTTMTGRPFGPTTQLFDDNGKPIGWERSLLVNYHKACVVEYTKNGRQSYLERIPEGEKKRFTINPADTYNGCFVAQHHYRH